MTSGRQWHAAVTTDKGVVLAGGAADVFTSTAELWDPVTHTTSSLPPMSDYHDSARSVGIGSGVLVTGGRTAGFLESSLAELWDGTSWTQSTMSVPHMFHTATVMGASGRVIVVGGQSTGSNFTDVCEIFEAGAWKLTAPIDGGPVLFQAASYLEKQDLLLVTGGTRLGDGSNTALTYRYSGGWKKLAGMVVPRTAHAQSVLSDGRVLVSGGNAAAKIHSSAEIFDPATESFSETAPMNHGRALHSSVTLPGGRVLVVGGFGSAGYGDMLSSAEIYDPATKRWLRAGSLTTPRAGHGTVLLADGRVAVSGGQFPMSPAVSGPATSTIEIFEQRKAGETCVDDGECVALRCESGRCPAAAVDAGPVDAAPADAASPDASGDAGTNAAETVRACTCDVPRGGRSGGSWALVALLALTRRRAREALRN